MADIHSRIQRRHAEFNQTVYGSSAREINRLLDASHDIAARIAPPSNDTIRPPGHQSIRDSHRVDHASKSNLRGRLVNTAEHARVVHEGRKALAMESKKMVWRNAGGPYSGLWQKLYVGPASPQPWLIRAYNQAATLNDMTTVKLMSEKRSRQFG